MPDETLTPKVLRELAALDAALAGEPVEPDLADLAELTRLLGDERPAPDESFARALDERARQRFARGVRGVRAVPAPRGAARLRAWLGAERTPLALAAVVSVLVVAVVAIAATRHSGAPSAGDGASASSAVERDASGGGEAAGTSGSSSSAGTSGSSSSAGTSGSSSSAGAGGSSSSAGTSGSSSSAGTGSEAARDGAGAGATQPAPAFAPRAGGSARTDARTSRFVERSASLTLGARPADVDDVADGVVRVTDAVGGFVATSTVTSRREASFELRIPSAQLPRALHDLSSLAHVRERTQATQDITTIVVSARDRLADARAERRGLLRRLARATTDARAAALRARLRTVSRQIARAKASLARAENRARYASVAVAVVADRSAGPAQSGTWTPGDALHDAGRILELAAGVALVAGAALVPLGLVAALAWLAGRRAIRRRRETALDAL